MGAAVDYIQNGYESYAYGQTLYLSLLAMIPRIIWPDKPVRLGGADIVSKYTGIQFAPDTSVGVGLVMEFYINFGLLGICIGYLLLGIILTLIDIICKYRLEQGDWFGFTYLFLPAVAIIGSETVFQITMTGASAVVFCVLVNRFILPNFIRRKRIHY